MINVHRYKNSNFIEHYANDFPSEFIPSEILPTFLNRFSLCQEFYECFESH